ncbi:methyltransferase [Micromonospora sonchi]|uniref:methyltransferase n=1 Tax=Micromonospora sonchi TaxID=1763543 RepID=UPI0016656A60|nr:methyltransferase [Micromonospora sonchi]
MDRLQSALALYQEAMGYTYAAALRAAATVNVADHLADGPRTAAELAAATGTDADGLRRVLRLLAARDVVQEHEGRFALTDKGAALRSDSPVPARAGILMFTDTMFWTMSHRVTDAMGAHRPAFDEIFGRSLNDYFDNDAEIEALYYEGMETVSAAEHLILARTGLFPDTGTVADVGGGRGGFLLTVLREHPGLQGILLDRAEVVARHRLDEPDVAGRWKVVAGDFLGEAPHADVHVLKRILHNWDDERSVRILTNCRRAMPAHGRVLVVDAVVPEGNDPHQSKEMDFMMLAARTGQERTAAELEPLFTAAGLRLERVVATRSAMSVAVGVPA